ncbi:DUF4188 domain-containing protein [Streptomyces sp. NPDC059378]|uniref:DUF4188 domain-containing protein n=1 Tax=Streptomyces sp. NPDC059378 TaxID=3346815 RepID=UPI00369D2304
MSERKTRYATAIPDRQSHSGLVLFHVGMRINRLRATKQWGSVLVAMFRMLRELEDHPELGMLGSESYRSGRRFLVVQYWRDLESLHAWSRSGDRSHFPAWRAFNRAIKESDAVGVFHETFVVGPDGSGTLYVDMPSTGMARAVGSAPATRSSAGPIDVAHQPGQ